MPLPGDGLIYEDPQFVSFDPYSYSDTSPCIDSGDPNETDPDGTRIDIGANYYHQEFIPSGDCNEDEELDVLDIIHILNMCILCDSCGDCGCADLTMDGQVNVLDIVMIVNIILYD